MGYNSITAAVPTISAAQTNTGTTITQIQDTFYFDITWDKAVTGFTRNDLLVSNACIASFTGSGSSYNVSVTPNLNRNGTITIGVPDDCVSSAGGNEPINRNFEYVTPTQPTIIAYDWPDSIDAGVGTFFMDIDFNVAVTDFTTSDLILDAPSSVSITSITWGATSIASQSDRALRTRGGTLSTVGAAGKQYYRINFTKTSLYAGQQVNLELKASAVLGPAPVNQT